jgi:hypothetical protein
MYGAPPRTCPSSHEATLLVAQGKGATINLGRHRECTACGIAQGSEPVIEVLITEAQEARAATRDAQHGMVGCRGTERGNHGVELGVG